jgi:GAF domain-containing protein
VQSLARGFDREHLLLVTNKLAEEADALAASNARFMALTVLNVELASERDPHVLLQKVCAGARDLFGSGYAVLAVKDKAADRGLFFTTSGIDFSGKPCTPPQIDAGPLGEVVMEGLPWRISTPDGHSIQAGLPDGYPPARAFLVVPLISPAHAYGWLCLADKIGADGFDADDERLLAALGTQVGHMYENGTLYVEIQHNEERFRHLAQSRRQQLNRIHTALRDIESMIGRTRARSTEERVSFDSVEMQLLKELVGDISRELNPIE